jgi:hypothetical protein
MNLRDRALVSMQRRERASARHVSEERDDRINARGKGIRLVRRAPIEKDLPIAAVSELG